MIRAVSAAPPPPPTANPYPGLRPFEEEETPLFFGREQQIDQMVDLLSRQRLLAVVGSSGSGKSSLVNCGLRPALRRGLMADAGTDWCMVRFRPGLRPLNALAQRLAAATPAAEGSASDDLPRSEVLATTLRLSRLGLLDLYAQTFPAAETNLLVVVDQFEEIFRYRHLQPSAAASGERQPGEADDLALVNLLLAAACQRRWPIFIVLTMRSDFLGDAAQFQGLPQAISAGLHLVPRLSRDERRQAISNPALVSGTRVEPVLLTQLVNDVGDDPDQLSILQHALRRTWEHWRQRGGRGPITLADYEAIGTMASALDAHAEQTLERCGDGDAIALCCRLFQALTDKASDPRGIRRPTPLADLEAICGDDPERLAPILARFRQSDTAFLMPPGSEPLRPDSVIDISHESLMRVWKRLDRWADEEAESAALYRRLADTARRHADGQAALWRDPELQQGLNWLSRQRPTLAWARRYDSGLDQSLAFLRLSEQAREQERRRRRRQRRRTLAGLAALSLLTSLVAAFFWNQWQLTRLSRARAFAATAAALLPGRPRASLLYGLAAMERLIEEPAEALAVADTLARAVNLNWEIDDLAGSDPAASAEPITALLPLRDGSWVAGTARGQLHRWRDGRPFGTPIATGQGEITCLLQLADGELLSGDASGSLRRWRDGQPQGTAIQVADAAVLSLAQLEDGELVSGDARGNLRRWRDFRPVGAPIASGQGRVSALLALPGGDLLSGGSGGEAETSSRMLRRWRRGEPLGPPIRSGHDGVLQLVALGGKVISLGGEGSLEVWQPGQAATAPWRRLPTPVRRLALRRDGRLVTSHDDGSLRLWNDDGTVSLGYAGSAGLRLLVGLADNRLLAADPGGGLHLLDPDGLVAQPVDSGQQGVWSLLALADGDLLSGGEDGRLRRWRQARPVGAPLAAGQGTVVALLALPGGDILSAGILGGDSGDPSSSLRRWRGGRALTAPLATPFSTLRQLLPDGQGGVLGFGEGADGSSLQQRWRTGLGAPAAVGGPQPLPPPRLNSVVALANGDLLSASRLDGTLQRWRRQGDGPPRRGEVIATGLDGIGSLALLPGDRFLAVGSVDRRSSGQDVRLFDLRSRAWVGNAIPLEAGWPSALAVLPRRGLVIGSTAGRLRWLEPRQILAAACRERRALGSGGASTAAGVSPDDLDHLPERACGSTVPGR